MSTETLELIIKLVFPICIIIIIRGFINMEIIKKSNDVSSESILLSITLIFFGYFMLAFFYYPACIKFNEFNIPGFLGFLITYLTGRITYSTWC